MKSRAHRQPFKERLKVDLNFRPDCSYSWRCSSVILLNVLLNDQAHMRNERQLIKMDGHRGVIANATYLIIRYYIKSLFLGFSYFPCSKIPCNCSYYTNSGRHKSTVRNDKVFL